MDHGRRTEYEKYRDEIAAWPQAFNKAVKDATSVSGALPPITAPSSANDAYKRVLRMVKEDGLRCTALDSLPPGDLTIDSAFTVVEGIDGLLLATQKP